jgi:5'-nucleotidase
MNFQHPDKAEDLLQASVSRQSRRKREAVHFQGPLTIAVSARTLFCFEKESRIFHKRGLAAFAAQQRRLEKVPLAPGPAFGFVRDMLALNGLLPDGVEPLVDAVIISSQYPDAGVRVLRSLKHHGLPIEKLVFTGNGETLPYLRAFNAHLLLSLSPKDVRMAVGAGIAAALMQANSVTEPTPRKCVNIALDGDGVVFSGEVEKMFQDAGLKYFHENEETKSEIPIEDGPYRGLVSHLGRIKKTLPDNIRIALVTARGSPAAIRALNTLRAWGVHIDEALFLAGLPKGQFLDEFSAHIFFDDKKKNVEEAGRLVPSGLVL